MCRGGLHLFWITGKNISSGIAFVILRYIPQVQPHTYTQCRSHHVFLCSRNVKSAENVYLHLWEVSQCGGGTCWQVLRALTRYSLYTLEQPLQRAAEVVSWPASSKEQKPLQQTASPLQQEGWQSRQAQSTGNEKYIWAKYKRGTAIGTALHPFSIAVAGLPFERHRGLYL